VGLPREQPLAPLPPAWLRAAGAARIVAATGAALAIGPPRTPRTDERLAAFPSNNTAAITARRVAVTLCAIAGLALSDVAWALGISEQATRHIANRPVDRRSLHAVGLRLALEDEVRRLTQRAPRFGR